MSSIRIRAAAFVLIASVVFGASGARAQDQPTPPARDPTAPTTQKRQPEPAPIEVERARDRFYTLERRWGPVLRVGTDYHLKRGESVSQVVIISSSGTIEGNVRGDVVCILGTVRLATGATIDGSLIVVGGTATVEPNVVVAQSLAVIGGVLDAPPDFSPGQEHVVIGGTQLAQRVEVFVPWLTQGLLLGRPIVPRLGWIWWIVVIIFLISLVLTLMFPAAVRTCVQTMARKPLSTFLVGLLVMLSIGPISVLLAVSVIGLAVVPILLCALVVAWILGKIAVDVWIGSSMTGQTAPDTRVQAARALAIGFLVITLAYMVPVLGFVVWALSGVLGLGAATLAFVRAFRGENPVPPKPVAPPPPPVEYQPIVNREPVAAAVAASAPVTTDVPTDPAVSAALPASLALFPKAAFLDRTAGFVLDVLLVLMVVNVFGIADRDSQPILAMLLYFIGFWTWKGTTLGGIICQLRVVRIDGQSLRFVDALVRGLTGLFSIAVFALGCLWILRDPDRQAWHDKIAGTYVVKVPRNWPL